MLTRPQYALFIALLLIAPGSFADIYQWQDADGNTVYSDQRSSPSATTTSSKNSVNYYPANKPAEASTKKPETTPPLSTTPLATLEAVEDSESDSSSDLTEAKCQEQYQLNCNDVVNWRKRAIEACGDDPRCKDEQYLERKYRPRTVAEIAAIARRAAIRNNRADEEIDQFLVNKYTSYCDNQAVNYCRNSRTKIKNCAERMERMCKDPRSLEELLASYDNLSPAEKQAIIEKAKKLALSNGNAPIDYEKLISGLTDILISQALMGF